MAEFKVMYFIEGSERDFLWKTFQGDDDREATRTAAAFFFSGPEEFVVIDKEDHKLILPRRAIRAVQVYPAGGESPA
ncbi:MAG: hypothetical protein V4671_04370 [Armatimonadota bacterium]